MGHEVDVTTAIDALGGQCIIAGNVEPAVLQEGTPSEVLRLASQCVVKGARAPRGFVLMPGCELPPRTPPYNVFMLVKAAQEGGNYCHRSFSI